MQKPLWSDVLQAVSEEDPQPAQVKSSTRRILWDDDDLPPITRRATKDVIAANEKWASSNCLPSLTEEEWEQWIEEQIAKADLTSQQKRVHRSTLKRLVKLLKKHHWLKPSTPDPSASSEIIALNRRNPPLVVDLRAVAASKEKQHQNPCTRLSLNAADHLPLYRQLEPHLTDEQRLDLIESLLDPIRAEREALKTYLVRHGKADGTIKTTLEAVDILLGYQHQQESGLAHLSFKKIIPVVQISADITDYESMDDYYLAQGKIEALAKRAGKDSRAWFERFFNDYGQYLSKGSKEYYLKAGITMGKCSYYPITDRTIHNNFEDIPAICALKTLRKQIPSDPPSDETLPLTWEQGQLILETQKHYVDDPYNYSTSKKTGKVKRAKRAQRSMALDMQDLIALGFLTAIPPLRAGTLGVLEIGDTLKHGKFEGNVFIPRSEMANPNDAVYYFDMGPECYKTGKIYGHYRTEIPNYQFKDGTSFSDCLDKWIYGGYRQTLLTYGQDHQFLFVKTRNKKNSRQGDPGTPESYEQMIGGITEKFTGLAIFPHEFRSMCSTHYRNLGLSKAELDALAYFMQHSSAMADKTYDRRTCQERTAPILNLFTKRLQHRSVA